MSAFIPNQKFKLRVTYKKSGVAAWISHLELLQSVEHAIRRSGLPYAVTQGFSPHMKISFCPALSVGIESENQVFDVVLTDYISPDKCLSALKSATSDCLMPLSCEYVDNDNSLAPVVGSVSYYCVEIEQAIDSINVPETITFKRKGKEKCVNLRDYFNSNPKIEKVENGTKILFNICYTDKGSLKPELVLRELLKNSGVDQPIIKTFKKS